MILFIICTSLGAASFYGAADFLGGLATRRAGIAAVVIPVQVIGIALGLAALPILHGTVSGSALLWGAAAGISGGCGIALLYHALAIGKMGVVSPITAVLAAALPVTLGLLRGEHASIARLTGIGIALVAVVLISLTTEEDGRFEFSTLGVKEAIASGVFLGGFFILIALAPRSGGLYPLIFARTSASVMLLLGAVALRQTLVPSKPLWALILPAGVMDMGANVLYVIATRYGYVSIAAVVTSLYPASTVLLARVLLGERLRAWQTVGLLLALVGVALISF